MNLRIAALRKRMLDADGGEGGQERIRMRFVIASLTTWRQESDAEEK